MLINLLSNIRCACALKISSARSWRPRAVRTKLYVQNTYRAAFVTRGELMSLARPEFRRALRFTLILARAAWAVVCSRL